MKREAREKGDERGQEERAGELTECFLSVRVSFLLPCVQMRQIYADLDLSSASGDFMPKIFMTMVCDSIRTSMSGTVSRLMAGIGK